jgi:hypothetical protein
MKPTLSLLLLVLLLSCKKTEVTIQDRIIGKWELRKTSSGWTGTINYSPGNGYITEFTETTYSTYNNAQLDDSGFYTIIKDTVSNKDRIIYNGVVSQPKTFISITDNKLSFSINIIDAGGSVYERIR